MAQAIADCRLDEALLLYNPATEVRAPAEICRSRKSSKSSGKVSGACTFSLSLSLYIYIYIYTHFVHSPLIFRRILKYFLLSSFFNFQ